MEENVENTAPETKQEPASVTETQETLTPKAEPKKHKAPEGQEMTKWLLAIAVTIIVIGMAYQWAGTEEPDFVITPPQKSTEHNDTVEHFEFDVKANCDLRDGFFNYSLKDGEGVLVKEGSIPINNQTKGDKLDIDIDVDFPGERPAKLVFKIKLSYGDKEQNPQFDYKKEINKDRYYKVVTTE